MENPFIIRVTRYYQSGNVRLHNRQIWDYGTLGDFLYAIRLITKNPRYKYEYYITSTSTPSFPFVRWSKKTRLPLVCKGKNVDLCGFVWQLSDRQYENDELPF